MNQPGFGQKPPPRTVPMDGSGPSGGGNGGGPLAAVASVSAGVALLGALLFSIHSAVKSAGERLATPDTEKAAVAIADEAQAPYCTPQFMQVLDRVLHSCGLMEGSSRRGCKPADVKTFASISDSDFNALFTPLKARGGVILFDNGMDTLDDGAKKLIEEKWSDRKGARYFLVVARASKSGSADKNQALSHRRANSVLFHIKEFSNEPDVDQKVGLLWLGSEFAQLDPKEFCEWPNSRDGTKCDDDAINRSAFASWVDCRL
jgi:outer membrane protein OmpA-like peptidoglycan-associated protein